MFDINGCVIIIIILIIVILMMMLHSKNYFAYFRMGDAKDVSTYQIPRDRFTTVRNFDVLSIPHSYHSQYRWYPENAKGGCYPEEIRVLPPGPGPRKNGSCPAVTKTQSECWKCCDKRTHNFVDRSQCRIYCGGLEGGSRPSFDPNQFLYG